MTALRSKCGHYIFVMFLASVFYLLSFLSPNLSSRRLDVYRTYTHVVALECMSETCCTRLAGNAGRKNDAKNCHLGTIDIAQLCRATSSQLRHASTIGKNLLNSNTSSRCPDNMVNFGPLSAEIYW